MMRELADRNFLCIVVTGTPDSHDDLAVFRKVLRVIRPEVTKVKGSDDKMSINTTRQ